MLSKITNFVKTHQAEIVLFIGVFMISLLSFLMGYIVSNQSNREPIKFEKSKDL